MRNLGVYWQCWSQDHSVRPSAKRIADWIKELLNQTATAQNVARGLLATVAKLVSASNSAYMFEREDALKKLRDMLDPGQVLATRPEICLLSHADSSLSVSVRGVS